MNALALLAAAVPTASGQEDGDGPAPLVSTFTYTGEVVTNVAGGQRRGASLLGVAGGQFTLELHPLLGWPGASVFALVLATHGGAPSDRVGDLQGVSNIEAPGSVWLAEAWLQQNLFGNRWSWLAGRYDVSTEFYRLQSAETFVNSSFGIGPEFAGSGRGGPSIYPNTSLGARIEFKPSHDLVFRVAALDGVPLGRPEGGSRAFAAGDGVLLVGEVALLSRPGAVGMPRERRFQIGRGAVRPYSGKVAIGTWWYSARFPDLSETLPTGEPVRHRGSGGVYAIGDRTLWSAGGDGAAALSAFVQLGLGDGRVNQVGGYLGAGLALTAPFRGRAEDAVGLAVAAALNGSHFERAVAAAGGTGTSETAIELTYLAQLGDWLAVQPDVQYVIHPGGAGGTRDALVAGVRVALSH